MGGQASKLERNHIVLTPPAYHELPLLTDERRAVWPRDSFAPEGAAQPGLRASESPPSQIGFDLLPMNTGMNVYTHYTGKVVWFFFPLLQFW